MPEMIENRMVNDEVWEQLEKSEDMVFCDCCDERIPNGTYYYTFSGLLVCTDCLPDFLEQHRHTAGG